MPQTTDPQVNERITERIKRNIESIAQVEKAFERQRTLIDRVSDVVSGFGGSIRFVAANGVLIAGWILWNLIAPREMRFDPTLSVLQLLIAMEALFLSAFVLMSQNRQNRQTDHWAHVDLQISMLAEQETTKMLQMMQKICSFLGMEMTAGDHELKQMTEQLPVANLVQEVGKARQPEDSALTEIAAVLVEENRHEQSAAALPATMAAESKTPPG